jgi:hypothetical protein
MPAMGHTVVEFEAHCRILKVLVEHSAATDYWEPIIHTTQKKDWVNIKYPTSKTDANQFLRPAW